VRQLEAEILKVAAEPAFQSKLEVEGAEPLLGNAKEYSAKIQEESRKWGKVVTTSGASV